MTGKGRQFLQNNPEILRSHENRQIMLNFEI